jgi:hypothetical protein
MAHVHPRVVQHENLTVPPTSGTVCWPASKSSAVSGAVKTCAAPGRLSCVSLNEARLPNQLRDLETHRQFEHEDATFAREVLNPDASRVGVDGLLGDSET